MSKNVWKKVTIGRFSKFSSTLSTQLELWLWFQNRKFWTLIHCCLVSTERQWNPSKKFCGSSSICLTTFLVSFLVLSSLSSSLFSMRWVRKREVSLFGYRQGLFPGSKERMRKREREDRKWMNEKKTEKEAERKSFMANESKDSLTIFLSLFLWFHLHLFSCDSFSFPAFLSLPAWRPHLSLSESRCPSYSVSVSLSFMSVVYVSSWVNSFSAPLCLSFIPFFVC